MRKLLKRLIWKRINGQGNIIEIHNTVIRKNFHLKVLGNNNTIIINKYCKLIDTNICILGNNCTITIDTEVLFYGPCNILMETGAKLEIKSMTHIRGVNFKLRGASCKIGEQCMFSYNINIRNHDGHPVIDITTRKARNLPKDIVLGDHVWVGQNSAILKGSNIGSDSVVAFGAVVTKGCETGCILAGNPAKVVKTEISWDRSFEGYI